MMKFYCSHAGSLETERGSDEANIALYANRGKANAKTITVGYTVMKHIVNAGLVPNSKAWDLLSIALSVISADAAIERKKSADGWTRMIDLQIAVNDPSLWSANKMLIESQLQFLSTDKWTIEFVDNGFFPSPKERKRKIPPTQDCVCLFSGGMDSFIGASDLISLGHDPYFVTQLAPKSTDGNRQEDLGRMLPKGKQIKLNHNIYCGQFENLDQREGSQRTRSVIFLAYGVLIATALAKYHSGDCITLYACENGFISINPPLNTSRIGALSTRTTHPRFLKQFQELLDAVGLNVKIKNPYQFKTKGEMLIEARDQKFLKRNIAHTTSCGRVGRRQHHCGRCFPCLIRRAAFHAWGERDNTVYENGTNFDNNWRNFIDVFSVAAAIAEIDNLGFDRWVRSRLNIPLGANSDEYKSIVGRGIEELRAFFLSQER